jgi:hypothetical protein
LEKKLLLVISLCCWFLSLFFSPTSLITIGACHKEGAGVTLFHVWIPLSPLYYVLMFKETKLRCCKRQPFVSRKLCITLVKSYLIFCLTQNTIFFP